MSDQNVSKEIMDLHMKQIDESLKDIRDSLSATALISQTVTENVIKIKELRKDQDKAESVTIENEKNIVELNTHKKYLSVMGLTAMGLIVAWIKTKI